jgi:hypothetical protein
MKKRDAVRTTRRFAATFEVWDETLRKVAVRSRRGESNLTRYGESGNPFVDRAVIA